MYRSYVELCNRSRILRITQPQTDLNRKYVFIVTVESEGEFIITHNIIFVDLEI